MPRWPFGGSVFAKTTVHAAWPAFVMNVFEPLRTYSSPLALRRRLDATRRRSRRPGSLRPNEQRIGDSRSGGSHLRFCSSSPARITGAGAERVRRDRDRDPGAAPESSSPISMPSKQPEAGAAVLLRHVDVHQPEVVRLRDHVGRVRRCSSYSAAFGRISFSANSRASSRSARCSSLSANEMPPAQIARWSPCALLCCEVPVQRLTD